MTTPASTLLTVYSQLTYSSCHRPCHFPLFLAEWDRLTRRLEDPLNGDGRLDDKCWTEVAAFIPPHLQW
jgi:hypothetical protein